MAVVMLVMVPVQPHGVGRNSQTAKQQRCNRGK